MSRFAVQKSDFCTEWKQIVHQRDTVRTVLCLCHEPRSVGGAKRSLRTRAAQWSWEAISNCRLINEGEQCPKLIFTCRKLTEHNFSRLLLDYPSLRLLLSRRRPVRTRLSKHRHLAWARLFRPVMKTYFDKFKTQIRPAMILGQDG